MDLNAEPNFEVCSRAPGEKMRLIDDFSCLIKKSEFDAQDMR